MTSGARAVGGRAILLSSLLAFASPITVLAQQEEPASRAPTEEATGRSARNPAWLELSTENRSPPSADMGLRGSWLTGGSVSGGCCDPGTGRAVPTPLVNSNAPWAFQASAARTSRLGNLFSGVIASRNYAAPLYSALPVSGPIQTGPTSTSQGNLSISETQWYLRAGWETPLAADLNGAAISVVTDFIVPLSTTQVTEDMLRIDAVPSRAIRFGVVFRW